jgi:hypothetical protein
MLHYVDLSELQQRYCDHAVTISQVYLIPLQTSICCYQVMPYFIAFSLILILRITMPVMILITV